MVKPDIIFGTYHIPDCEHMGDVDRAITYLENLGCTINEVDVVPRYEGSSIDISFPAKKFGKLYKELVTSTTFDTDINIFLKTDDGYVSKNEYSEIANGEYQRDIDENFIKSVPVRVFFEVTEKNEDKINNIISDIEDSLGETSVLLTKTKYVVDGNTFVSLIYNVDINSIDNCAIIGDSVLWNTGWFGDKKSKYGKIYGSAEVYNKNINMTTASRDVYLSKNPQVQTKYDVVRSNIEKELQKI